MVLILQQKHIFIINPTAGKVNALVALSPKIKAIAKQRKLPFIIRQTEYKGHAEILAREYAKTNEDIRLYACGGDGTLNEVIKGAYEYNNVEIGCIPCGTGNDFIRSFGEENHFDNIEDIIDGTAVDIDLIKVNDDISAAITSVGLDAEVGFGVKNYRRIPLVNGKMAYHFSIIQQVLNKLGRYYRVELDNEVIEGEFLLIAVCNGKAYGGGVMASPLSNVQDGILEVNIVKKISRLKIASVISKYKKGEHLTNDGEVIENLQEFFTYKTTKKICITALDENELRMNLDGECVVNKQLQAHVIEKATKFIIPKNLYNSQFLNQ